MSVTSSFAKLILKAKDHTTLWKMAFFVFLAGLVGMNVVLHPHHAHFALETRIGFWAGFGVAVSVTLILVLKKIIYPLINKPEAFYDRSE